jgi:hypothetical protein
LFAPSLVAFDIVPKNEKKKKLKKKRAQLQHLKTEAVFLVRVHPEPCLILSRAQIRALFCSSKSKFIPA